MRRPAKARLTENRVIGGGSEMQSLNAFLRHLRSRWVVLLHDTVMIPIAWLGAYWLRYNLAVIPEHFLRQAFVLLPLVVLAQLAVYVAFGTYRGVWRFASLPDLVRILKAVALGTAIVAISIFFMTRLLYVPRSVFILYGILLVGLLGGPRFVYRMSKDRHFSATEERKVLVVGAGAAGESLVRDLLRNSPRIYQPFAFIDDDPAKLGKEIHGIRVIGDCDAIVDTTEQWKIDLIVLALPSASARQMRRIVERCEQTGVPFRTLPKLHDLVSGEVSINELREVRIDDLLGREPVSLDWQGINRGLAGRRILVTGGGGSIGSELCRQLARIQPAALIVYERSEFNLYSIELELRREFPDMILHAELGDICDDVAVERVFEAYRPEIVFHAAAYKHVPMLEKQAREAVRNNVLGTRTLALAADRAKADAFVMISTDKAVNPHNIMGASKRTAEIFCQALSKRSQTRYITVRFGNVLGSAGSVVPLFRSQIAKGGPVTVTHPDVTRYFMTTAEASQLILQASVMGKGGEIYVLDMGEPIRIGYLAEQMIRLSGKKPGEDIDIVYTGLRPGEKLFEELFHPEERLTDTSHEKILLAQSRDVDWGVLKAVLENLAEACVEYDQQRILGLMKQLVPEHAEWQIGPDASPPAKTAIN
jgi:FlaA1/EpsC-like NDP-sugar epimerase